MRYDLRKFRKEFDLTQKELAKKLGISRTYLAQLEVSKYQPGEEVLSKIREQVLAYMLQRNRSIVSDNELLKEGFEVREKLYRIDKEQGTLALGRTRVCVMHIYDKDSDPIVTGGASALLLSHRPLGAYDLILLDDPKLDILLSEFQEEG